MANPSPQAAIAKDDATKDSFSARRQPSGVSFSATEGLHSRRHKRHSHTASRGSTGKPRSHPPSLASFESRNSWHTGQKFRDRGRPKFSSPFESVLTMLAYSIGLSNIFVFCFNAHRSGGLLVYMIPYSIALCLVAFPIAYMELLLGQFVQQGCISMWKILPIAKGIGYAIQGSFAIMNLFYHTPLYWSTIYFFEGFYLQLGYTKCDNPYNKPTCFIPSASNYHRYTAESGTTAGSEYFQGRVLRIWPSAFTDGDAVDEVINGFRLAEEIRGNFNSSTENPRFGFNTRLGTPILDLSLCSCATFLCYFFLQTSSLRVKTFVAGCGVILPFIFLSVLGIRGISTQGAYAGVAELLRADFSTLLKPQVWFTAVNNAWLSTIGNLGSLSLVGSHNPFKFNIWWHAIILLIVDTAFAVLGALVVFCFIGETAAAQKVNVTQIVNYASKEETVLIFEIFPDSLGRLPGTRTYAFIYFAMVTLLVFTTMFHVMNALVEGYTEEFSTFFPKEDVNVNSLIGFLLTSWAFVLNLLTCTRGGIWLIKFLEEGVWETAVLFVIFLEIVLITWVWGIEDLCQAAQAVSGKPTGIFLRICWKILTPLIVLVTAVNEVTTIKGSAITYNMEEAKSPALVTLGRALGMSPLIFVPGVAIYQLLHYPAENFSQRLKLLLAPENEHKLIKRGEEPKNRRKWKHLFHLGLKDAKKRDSMPTAMKSVMNIRRTSSRAGGHHLHPQEEENQSENPLLQNLLAPQYIPNLLDPHYEQNYREGQRHSTTESVDSGGTYQNINAASKETRKKLKDKHGKTFVEEEDTVPENTESLPQIVVQNPDAVEKEENKDQMKRKQQKKKV